MTIVPAERGILQIRTIERNVLRNAIDDHAIAAGFRHLHSAQLDELGSHAVNLHAVDLLHQRGRKSILHAEHDADFVHGCLTFILATCHRT